MGILDFARDMTLEALWKKESLSRKLGQLNLKMEIFVAAYPGTVLEQAIPGSASRSAGGYSNEGLFVCCYVRGEFDKGHTIFYWFNNMPDAARYAEELRLRSGCTRVVGPYMLPKGKDERFR
jgi:hypothetical protein